MNGRLSTRTGWIDNGGMDDVWLHGYMARWLYGWMMNGITDSKTVYKWLTARIERLIEGWWDCWTVSGLTDGLMA